MEKWEVAHITTNLATLIKNTRCSAVLKAGLKAKELLTDEEDERLTALGRNEGLTCEAKLLYEIMMTRSRGHTGLMEELRDTRQDGAFKILQEGLQRANPQFALNDSAVQLMNMRVQFANCTKSFNDMFPWFTMDEVRELVGNVDLKIDLEELLKKSLEIKLDCELPPTPALYLPRLLSNRLQLNPRIFTLDTCVDVFVFTNISRIELTQLVKPHATLSSTGQRSLVTGRQIYLDDEEDWDDMVAVSKSPIHLVSAEDGGYILQRTTKVTDVLQNHVLTERRRKEAFVTEDSFVEELLSHNNSKGGLICDVAGMGKTWLMQSLAAKIRAKSDNFVVFLIELSSLWKFLSGLEQTLRNNKALTIILSYVLQSQLASHLLYKHAVRNGLKFVFILDGYDEISVDDIEVVNYNLQVLSKLDHISMVISSRPNMRTILQKTFNLIAFDILPFHIEEQMRCIIDQWAHVCPQSDSELSKLKKFALQCIKSVKSIENDDIHDILGVPLKCRILAAVNEPLAKQLCKETRRRDLEIVEAATIKSVFDLYTKFVDCLVDKVTDAKPADAKNDFVNGIFVFYTHMALEVLFPDLSNTYLEDGKFDGSMEEHFNRVGVASFNPVQQRLEFIHRSFAEYFVGRFFAEFWNDIEQHSTSFVNRVASYFIRNVLVAVYGYFDINPIQLKKRYRWEMHAFSKKHNRLKYPLILLFMNLHGQKLQLERSNHGFRNLALTFETKSNITTKITRFFGTNTEYSELCGIKRFLAKSCFMTMVACIDERLTNIFSLYVHIFNSFIDLKSRAGLLLPSNHGIQNIDSTEWAVWLLCKAAVSKSPANAVELFNMFGDSEENFLSLLCRDYPEYYLSPLEVAIITQDVDMILYFVDKISIHFDRLFFACVGFDQVFVQPDVDAKLKIMKIVLGSSDRVLNFLRNDSLYIHGGVFITKYSFQLLHKFVEDSKLSFSSIKSENKIFILKECLNRCNNEELVNLLLSLYGKSDDKKLSIVKVAAGRTFTAEAVLDALRLVEVRDAFSVGELDPYGFANCLNLETLKVLLTIEPDFCCCNWRKCNYLHVAASALNIDWVNYLINSGYEVDQLDNYGETPLLWASQNETDNPKMLLAVTRLLVENGANVYAKDDMTGGNIAHWVFRKSRNPDSKDLCEWVSYFLENGYNQLWEMRDTNGKTPQRTLIDVGSKNCPMTNDVLRLLESYSVVSTD